MSREDGKGRRGKTDKPNAVAGQSARGDQVAPREVEKRRSDSVGPPAADSRKTAEVRRSEPSEDFAQRDLETVDETPEQHDRRRHARGPGE